MLNGASFVHLRPPYILLILKQYTLYSSLPVITLDKHFSMPHFYGFIHLLSVLSRNNQYILEFLILNQQRVPSRAVVFLARSITYYSSFLISPTMYGSICDTDSSISNHALAHAKSNPSSISMLVRLSKINLYGFEP